MAERSALGCNWLSRQACNGNQHHVLLPQIRSKEENLLGVGSNSIRLTDITLCSFPIAPQIPFFLVLATIRTSVANYRYNTVKTDKVYSSHYMNYLYCKWHK